MEVKIVMEERREIDREQGTDLVLEAKKGCPCDAITVMIFGGLVLRILHLPFPVIIGLHTGPHGE